MSTSLCACKKLFLPIYLLSDVMTKLNGIEENGGEMKEMKPIINHSQHSRQSSINTTCLSEASRHVSITNESPKIVLSGGPKHLQNHHHHHRHHKHKPQQQQARTNEIDVYFIGCFEQYLDFKQHDGVNQSVDLIHSNNSMNMQ